MYYIIAYWSCVLGIPLSVEGRCKFKIAAGMLYSRECEWTLSCGPLERNISICTLIIVSLLKAWKVTVVRDRVLRCSLVTSFQEGPHQKLFFQGSLSFCKQGGKLDYSRYSQVSLLTLCYHWQTLRISFLLEMMIAKDH